MTQKRKTILMAVLFTVIWCLVNVAAGSTTYYVDPNGNDDENGLSWATAFATIQKGFDSAEGGNPSDPNHYDVIDVNSGTYTTKPIWLWYYHNYIRLRFQENVEVVAMSLSDPCEPNDPNRPDSFAYPSGSLFKGVYAHHIIFDGNNTVFRMNKDEYEGEHHMAICLYSCNNIEIEGLTVKDSGGDGIYIGSGTVDPKYCENIVIRNVISDNNKRCAIGIISVNDLTIENCILKNTNGTPPECGIAFEPNYSFEKLKNIVVRNCKIEGTAGYGLKVDPWALREDANSEDIDLLFEDIFIEDCVNSIQIKNIYDDGVDGSITFKNITVEGGRYGLYLSKSSKKASASFEECIWRDIDAGEYPIKIVLHYSQNYPVEYPVGIDFTNCQVFDDVNRPAIIFAGNSNDTLYEISGNLYVKNDNRSGSLYDWNGADTNNVTISVNAGVADFARAYNRTRYKWYSSIQSAINDSDDEDVIEVSPTTHYEAIDFKNKAVTLRGFDPYDRGVVAATIIDGDDARSAVITFNDGENSNSIVEGITLTGGKYGVSCSSSASLVIANCIIENNKSHGIYCSSGSPEIMYNEIRFNGRDGINSSAITPLTVKNNLVYDNKRDGMEFNSATLAGVVRNNTIVNNSGYGIYVSSGMAPAISNCILWGNKKNDLEGCNATYSCIEDEDVGAGNISNYPSFVDAENKVFHLNGDSQCIDAGDPNGDYYSEVDIDGQMRVMVAEVDIGADEAAYFPSNHNDYDEWVTVDKPDCWCSQRQCRGDTDNFAEGGSELNYWVAANDLDVMLAAWQKKYSLMAGQAYNGTPLICADFDHYPEGGPKLQWRVSVYDLNILLANWQVPDGPDPNCFDSN